MEFMTTYNRVCKGLFLIGVMFFCVVLVGWANNWEDIRRESAKIKSVSAHFTQEKYLQILTGPLVSKGLFYFQAPDSVRWEYTSPIRSVLLMRKGDIRRYTAGSKGLIEDKGVALESMQMVLQEISHWNTGQFTANENFSAALKGGRGAKIILTPKEKGLSLMISHIVITLSPDQPGVIKSVRITESEGNYTLFEFSDVQINGKIGESLFREVG